MLLDKINEYHIILASRSPRRKHLLEELGIHFETSDLHDVEEKWPDGLDKFQIPVWLSELKSDAWSGNLASRDILITADTIVWFEDRVIHKPSDRSEALEILDKLQGNSHEVITGVTLRNQSLRHSFCAHSEVRFGSLDHDEIAFYVDHYKPYDKAGAYGIQEWIGYAGIKEIHGSFYNVMGLPVEMLYRFLGEFIQQTEKSGTS